jgi:lipoprotein-releasing system ATP-binding protein
MDQAVIVCDNVSKKFNQNIIFDHISVTFFQGISYALQGVSGTGKSTFLSLIGYLDEPTSGVIKYNRQDLRLLSPAELNYMRMTSLGYLFQQPYLIKELSVIENIQLPGLLMGLKKKYCIDRALMLLSKVHLLEKEAVYPGELSGGELQRVALARALFNKPTFLVADEPTASLDAKTAQEIVSLLIQLQKEWNMGLILSTHDESIAQRLDEQYLFFEQTLLKK